METVKTKETLVDKSEDYKKGYYDGYHKGYSDKKSAINKAKKEAKAEYDEKIKNLAVHTIFPFNVAYLIAEDSEKISFFSPELIYKAMNNNLNARQMDVLVCRYRDGKTLDETAKQFGVTRERIHQCEARAISRLSDPAVFNSMRAVSYSKYRDLEYKYETISYAYNHAPEQKDVEELVKESNITEMPIAELDLSVRTHNCLRRAGISTIGELIAKTETEMTRVRNLGKRSLFEIKQKLAELGLGFKEEEIEEL